MEHKCIGTCKTCKFWDNPQYEIHPYYVPRRWSQPEMTQDLFQTGTCKSSTMIYTGDGDYMNEGNELTYGANAEPGDVIRTGQDFGCIHWEERIQVLDYTI